MGPHPRSTHKYINIQVRRMYKCMMYRYITEQMKQCVECDSPSWLADSKTSSPYSLRHRCRWLHDPHPQLDAPASNTLPLCATAKNIVPRRRHCEPLTPLSALSAALVRASSRQASSYRWPRKAGDGDRGQKSWRSQGREGRNFALTPRPLMLINGLKMIDELMFDFALWMTVNIVYSLFHLAPS